MGGERYLICKMCVSCAVLEPVPMCSRTGNDIDPWDDSCEDYLSKNRMDKDVSDAKICRDNGWKEGDRLVGFDDDYYFNDENVVLNSLIQYTKIIRIDKIDDKEGWVQASVLFNHGEFGWEHGWGSNTFDLYWRKWRLLPHAKTSE